MKYTIVVLTIFICINYTALSQTRYNPNTKLENIEHYNQIETNLPNGNTYIDDLGLSIRHPDNWIMSSFHVAESTLLRDFSEWGEQPQPEINLTFFVFAPEAVDLDKLYNYKTTESIPMLIVQPTIFVKRDGITYEVNIDFSARGYVELNLPEISQSYGYIQGTPIYRSVALHLLASEQNWQEKQDMYEAMMEFPLTFQYVTHPDLQHMFLWWDFYFSYPESWEIKEVDSSIENYMVDIMMSMSGTSIEIHVQRPSLGKVIPFEQIDKDVSGLQQFLSENDITQEQLPKLVQAFNESGCDLISPPMYFDTDDTYGFVRLYRLLQIRITVEKIDTVNELPLSEILESFFQLSMNACG